MFILAEIDDRAGADTGNAFREFSTLPIDIHRLIKMNVRDCLSGDSAREVTFDARRLPWSLRLPLGMGIWGCVKMAEAALK